VVYPLPPDEDLLEQFIKQGNPIRERQHVFSIPDTDVLQVSTSVHEAIVNEIQPEMQARVWIDAYPELELRAEVQSVSRFPDELGDWRRSTVKFYETKVKLLDQAEGLRPGMSAKVEILRDLQRDVLAVPVQAIVQRGRAGLCYVLGSAPELRRVRLGKASFDSIAVLEGLSAGERVVLSPDLLGIPSEELDEVDGQGWDREAPAEGVVEGPVEEERGEQETQYEAALLGPGGLSGEAEYEIQTSSAGTTYEFELKVQGGMPLAVWDVAVDGIVIGSIALDATGAHEFEWKSEHRTFPDNFPLQAGAGSTVVVGPDLRGTLALP
jgi:hypothetical protein